MKLFSLLPVLLFALPASGDETANIAVSKRSKAGELVLTAKTCEPLRAQAQAICEWKQAVEPGFTFGSLPKCESRGKNGFQIKISDCLPDLAKKHLEKQLYSNGPNCHGTAMSFHGLFSKPRFMWSEEMLYWMDTPLCRKLQPDEKKLPGDLVNVFGPEYLFPSDDPIVEGRNFVSALYPGRIVRTAFAEGRTGYQRLMHTATYITDDLMFEKLSPNKDDRFVFHPAGEVYARPRDKDCQENQNIEPYLRENGNRPKNLDRDLKCPYISIVYRCQNINGYFDSQSLSDKEARIYQNIRKMQKLQEQLFEIVLTGDSPIGSKEIDLILTTAAIDANGALEELRSIGAAKNRDSRKLEEMLLASEYFTAQGLKKSIEQAKRSSQAF